MGVCRNQVKAEISKNLQEIKERSGYSLNFLADILEVPVGTLEGYLYGRTVPAVETIIAISNRLHISINNLLRGLIDKPTEQETLLCLVQLFSNQEGLKAAQLRSVLEQIISTMIDEYPTLEGADFGERIRILREDARTSKTMIANACGISENSWKIFESNQKFPSVETLINICGALGVSPEYLLISYITYPTLVDRRFYMLTPRQLETISNAATRLQLLL